MTLSTHRSLAELSEGILGWLDATGEGPHDLRRCELASGGLSSETVLCESRSWRTDATREFVVRLAPVTDGAFPDYDLGAQAEAQRVAHLHGIPVPTPVEFVNDSSWLGAPFLVSPFVRGHVPSAMPLLDEWLTGSSIDLRARLYGSLIEQLAAVHRIDVHSIRGAVPVRDIDRELAYWRSYLDWYADGERVLPALDDALAWCRANRPDADPPPCLLWGDVRLGNVIFDERGNAVAVLDWEMTMIGAAEHDVAWWLALEAIQDELMGRRVDGFPSVSEARATYERRAGRVLQDIDWFEVLALVRSTAVMTRLAMLHERAGMEALFPIGDNPILPIIARRIEEVT